MLICGICEESTFTAVPHATQSGLDSIGLHFMDFTLMQQPNLYFNPIKYT